MINFTVTEEHIKLLKSAYVRWGDCEYGAPTIDCKRPYGNSSVTSDIVEILGWEKVCPTCGHNSLEDGGLSEELCKKARKIHQETETALQIFLSTGLMIPGTYQRHRTNLRKWTRIE